MTPRPIEALERVRDHRGAVLVVGSANVDGTYYVEALPAPGETVVTERYAQGVGGKGANQAAAAARIGAGVGFVARVGADPAGEFVLRTLGESGVDVGAVRVTPGSPTGNAAIAVDRAGENSIIVAAGANARLAASDVDDAAGRFTGAVVVVQGEISPEVIERVSQQAMRCEARLVVNLAPFVPVADEALRAAEVLVVNETEAVDLAEHLGLGHSSDASHGQPLRGLAVAIVERLSVDLVVTLGAAGSLVVSGGELIAVTGRPAARVVDTTGAGDAFVGALSAGLAAGIDLHSSVELATHYAAESVAAAGTVASYPTVAELLISWGTDQDA